MISFETLRERIVNANAWRDIIEALELDISPELLSKSASDEVIGRAFVDGSIKSEKLRDKLHKHPFPDISRLGKYSDYSLKYHVGEGLTNAIQISSKAKKHQHPLRHAAKVLDFGCGTSRILRYFVEFLPGPQYYASEVFFENVKWGKYAFPEVIYLHQNNFPPLVLSDASLEIIYAYSIFTHFEEKLHLEWLSELHRLLKPEGLLILTLHGEPILNRCKNEETVRQPMCMEGRNYEEIYNQFMKDGFAFYNCYDQKSLAEGGLDSEVFGIAYISKEYIRRHWANRFEILEHDEGAVINWQDYVVLKKR
ncbi:MAG: class I SAM-dependent methyltransferase [Syntrophales bacterium]|jgi:SAM-dependent methyltransferase